MADVRFRTTRILSVLVIFLHVVTECSGYVTCSYSSYSYSTHKTYITYYRCSSNQYCCGTHSCCTLVYARWYLWCFIVVFLMVAFSLWWYYRYRYRPHRNGVVVAAPMAPPTTVTAFNTYPSSTGPVTFVPAGAGGVHYAAYPPPTYPPPMYSANGYPTPPAYSSVVPGGTRVTTVTQ